MTDSEPMLECAPSRLSMGGAVLGAVTSMLFTVTSTLELAGGAVGVLTIGVGLYRKAARVPRGLPPRYFTNCFPASSRQLHW